MGLFGKKPGKMLEKDRLMLEDSLEFYQQQMAVLNDNYNKQMSLYEELLSQGAEKANDAAVMLKCAESTQKMIMQATAQYTEVYNRINQNSEISKRDSDKTNCKVSTAVGVGTAIGSLTLGALSLSQAVVTDNQGLMTRKNVKHFFDSINPIRILKH
jgi:ElaB/YqjD/DUF883 family membrane-anchored ribosome-binding protein